MPHIHDHDTAPLSGRPDQTGPQLSGHPPWCSPQHCFLNEDGVQIHEQEPVRWEECEVRFESRLLFPDDEHPPTTYLQLSIENLRLTWRFVDVFLPITTARRLRDQLTAHLDAAQSCPSAQAETVHSNLTLHGDGAPAAGTDASWSASVRPPARRMTLTGCVISPPCDGARGWLADPVHSGKERSR
jgi:hypothetical protein